jgi:hypothetical protein
MGCKKLCKYHCEADPDGDPPTVERNFEKLIDKDATCVATFQDCPLVSSEYVRTNGLGQILVGTGAGILAGAFLGAKVGAIGGPFGALGGAFLGAGIGFLIGKCP